MLRPRMTQALVGMMATGMLLTACSSGSTSSNQSSGSSSGASASGSSSGGSSSSGSTSSGAATTYKKGGTVTIANVGGQTWSCQFNPFNPAVYQESFGFVYEPLVYINLLKNQAETPMLASSYAWGAGKKSITFMVRNGVKWSDGTPFTAKDVAFTFDTLKKTPSTDLYSLWTGAGLKSVTAKGDKVTMSFAKPASAYFWYFASQVPIVPQHIFARGAAAAHPGTWADAKPVGTGPFMVSPCGSNNIQYTANPTYWQKGKPYLSKIEYPAYLDNGPANLDLASGKAQWGSQFIPNIARFYTSKSSDNHTWSPPATNVSLYPNVATGPTSKLAVRQAIAMAVNRTQVATVGEDGQQPAANQSGVVIPTFQKYYDASAVSSAGYAQPNTAKATKLMSTAGYSPSKPLKLNVITVTGYTDWDASLAVIKQNLAPIGIDLTVQDMAQQSYDAKLYNGNFQLAYYGDAGGPTPYYELRQLLYSKNSAPIGKGASTNFERYMNPAVDKLLDQYTSASDAEQVAIVKKISGYMLKDVPVIPMTESVDWFQYNTKDLQGWPTEQNQYAQPAAFNVPDVEQVLLHLYSKSAQ